MSAAADLPTRDLPVRSVVAPLAPSYEGETYYGRNVVKASPFTDRVAVYIFLGGLSGSAEILATVADLFGDEEMDGVVAKGRLLSLVGAVSGPLILISHLHTPQRFYNMLRIFRGTSPMSYGGWTLVGFSGLAFLAAGARLAGLRRAEQVLQIPASVLGAVMSVYTAGLLSATSTPFWAAAPRALAGRFGSSSMAAAAAALALLERVGGNSEAAEKLEGVAAVALGVELVAGIATERAARNQGVRSEQAQGWRAADELGGTLTGAALPLAALVLNRLRARPSSTVAVAAGLAILAGSALMKISVLHLGNASARSGEDYLRFTQPR